MYDRQLVTDLGESILSQLDDAANRLLNAPISRASYFKDQFGFIGRSPDGRRLAYSVEPRHYAQLKLFALSMFWRASASSRPEVAGFKLPVGVEQHIATLLLTNNAGPADELGVIIVRYTNPLGAPAISPSRLSVMGAPFAQVTFGHIHLYMKLANNPTPAPLDELQLAPDRPITILLGDFLETGLGRQIREQFNTLYGNSGNSLA